MPPHDPAQNQEPRCTTPPAAEAAPAVSETLSAPPCPPAGAEGVYPSAASSGPPGVALRIGAYEVVEELGRGGMGVVYRARHMTLGHEVALKMIRGGHAGDEDRARFLLE